MGLPAGFENSHPYPSSMRYCACLMENAPAPSASTPQPGNRQLQGIARGSVLNLLTGVVAAVATFSLTVVLTRTMSPQAVGVFFTTTSLFILLTSLGQLGTSTGLVYFLARARPAEASGNTHHYLRVAALPVLVVAAVCGVVLFLFASPLAAWMGSDARAEVTSSLRILAFFVCFAASLNLFTSATRGLGTMRPTAVLDQVARPLLQLILIAAAIPTGDARWVVFAWLLPYVPTAVGAQVWWRRLAGPRREADGAAQSRMRSEFWRFTAPRSIASVAQAVMQRLDIVLVGALAGLPEAAIYTAATRFLVLGQLAGTSISRAVQPKLARAIGRGDHDAAQTMYRTATTWLVLLVWPFYLVLAFASTGLLHLFGPEYEAGAPTIVVLSLTMLVATACGMVDVVLTMAGRTTWNLYNVLVALAVNVVLDLLLIPSMGIMGAAVGWAAAILFANLLPLAQIAYVLRTHPFGASTLTACGLAGICYGLIPRLLSHLFGSGAFAVLLSLLIATAGYVACVVLARRVLNLGDVFTALTRPRHHST